MTLYMNCAMYMEIWQNSYNLPSLDHMYYVAECVGHKWPSNANGGQL
jgi:hypothetical protein